MSGMFTTAMRTAGWLFDKMLPTSNAALPAPPDPHYPQESLHNTGAKPVSAIPRLVAEAAPKLKAAAHQTSVVNNNQNTTYNYGDGEVVNNNWINNYIGEQETNTKTIKTAIGDTFVPDARLDEQPEEAGCMPGTRLRVLSEFMTWVKDDPRRIFWLSGLPGTGKTSIALTLCRLLRDEPGVLLGGTFFCVNAGSRMDALCILPTLAVTLADQSPEFAAALAEELLSDARAVFKPAAVQIRSLLQRPLAALASSEQPVVFVIDALDECSDQGEVMKLLQATADFVSDAKVTFIITSRPTTHINPISISTANTTHNCILELNEIDADEVTKDIHLYIADAFSKHLLDDSEAWYTDADVATIAARSRGLFTFASTMVTYCQSSYVVVHSPTVHRLIPLSYKGSQSCIYLVSLLRSPKRQVFFVIQTRAVHRLTAVSDTYVLDAKSLTERRSRLQNIFSAAPSSTAMKPHDAMYEFYLACATAFDSEDPEELWANQQMLESMDMTAFGTRW